MPRNYSLPTIKVLFAEASTCGYPGCGEPLVFRDRGRVTAVAEIAHIRSGQRDGPRHEAAYSGDIDGPENLILLCGKHHRPVDRHEEAYSVEELERWKQAQRAAAGGGTELSERDLRSYRRLTEEERRVLNEVARLAQRLARAGDTAQCEVDEVLAAAERARLDLQARHPPSWGVDEAGNRIPAGRFELPPIEQREWAAQAYEAKRRGLAAVTQARDALHEELAVLRMSAQTLSGPVEALRRAATAVGPLVGDRAGVTQVTDLLERSVQRLWTEANGD